MEKSGAMTETMRVLKFLRDQGECTLLQVVDGTDIPSGRAIAWLNALVRTQDAVKARRDHFDRFTITEAGRDRVESGESPAAASSVRGVRRAG